MPTKDHESYQTTIRVLSTVHDSITAYAQRHNVAYSSVCNLMMLKGLQAEGLISQEDLERALLNRRLKSTPSSQSPAPRGTLYAKKTNLIPRKSPTRRR